MIEDDIEFDLQYLRNKSSSSDIRFTGKWSELFDKYTGTADLVSAMTFVVS